MNKKVVDEPVELAHKQAKEERERAIKGALKPVTTKYLASDTFQVIKAGCFLEGFKNFWEIAPKAYPNWDLFAFVPNKEEEEAEEG